MTKAVAENSKSKENVVMSIIKEHFSKSTELYKELKIYKCILETENFDRELSKSLLSESKSRYDSLDRKKIFSEQNKLINRINKEIGRSVFNNFVPQYKDIATIYQIFNRSSSAKQQVILENQVVDILTKERKTLKNESKQVDSLVVRTFFKKFNEKYNKALLSEQKDVLKHFITDSGDNIEFKLYLNEEIGRIKTELRESKVAEREDLLKVVDSFRKHEINYNLVEKVIKLQQLVHEIKQDGNQYKSL